MDIGTRRLIERGSQREFNILFPSVLICAFFLSHHRRAPCEMIAQLQDAAKVAGDRVRALKVKIALLLINTSAGGAFLLLLRQSRAHNDCFRPDLVGAQEEKADKAVIEQAVQALKQLKIELDAAVKVAVDASQKEAKDKCAPLRAHRAQHCQHTLQRALKTPNMRCCLSTGRRSARSSPRCWSIECSTCRPSKSMVASPGCTITAPLAAP